MCLHDDTAAGRWVIVGADFVLVSVHVVDVGVAFPLITHFIDGDQLDCLSLGGREGGRDSLVKRRTQEMTPTRASEFYNFLESLNRNSLCSIFNFKRFCF